MKAILFDNYGDTSVMYCGEIEQPEINEDEVKKLLLDFLKNDFDYSPN